MNNPVVSVIVTTYNHEKYIAECLDSILMQEGCPDFEVIIGNDCSTDGTGKIIDDYANKYPDKIRVLPRPKNLGMLNNMKDCFANANGDFIAICEGDDYWTDKCKLKKQYEALCADDKAKLVFNDIVLLEENDEKRKLTPHLKSEKAKLSNKITIQDVIKNKNPIANFSCCMYKKEALDLVPTSYYEGKENADFLFNLYVLDKTEYALFLKDKMSVYRINPQGLWSGLPSNEKLIMNCVSIYKCNKIFDDKYKKEFYDWVRDEKPLGHRRIFGLAVSVSDTKRLFFGIMELSKLKIGIMQPYFFPYLGYWQLMNAVDKYVVYDDVNFIKGGWINRNNILLNAQKHLLTLPLNSASPFLHINQINITSNQKDKINLLKTFEQAYKKAPFFNDVFPLLENIINVAEQNLALFLCNQIKVICEYLGIETEIILSSCLEKNNKLKGQDKVVEICKKFQADTYINAIGGQEIYDKQRFAEENIRLNFIKMNHIVYPQFKNGFVPDLSIIDVLMFNGKDGTKRLLDKYELI